ATRNRDDCTRFVARHRGHCCRPKVAAGRLQPPDGARDVQAGAQRAPPPAVPSAVPRYAPPSVPRGASMPKDPSSLPGPRVSPLIPTLVRRTTLPPSRAEAVRQVSLRCRKRVFRTSRLEVRQSLHSREIPGSARRTPLSAPPTVVLTRCISPDGRT